LARQRLRWEPIKFEKKEFALNNFSEGSIGIWHEIESR